MFWTEFVFAGRCVRQKHETLADAEKQAGHVLASWRTVDSVTIQGGRRDGYPHVKTVTRD
jgi:hypothetical protein